jgi:energy-coupling factor transport system ATP-binding protein
MSDLGHPVAEIQNLGFTYAGSQNPAIAGINIALFPHELTVLMGPTGCGKSTLALCLNGLIPHVVTGQMTGRVIVDGFDTMDHPVYEMATRVGLVFQDPEAQLCHLHGEDDIAFGCENLKIARETITERINEVAEILDIKEILRKPVHTLSLGQKQRIAAAAVLAMKPKLLVLDEPTSNLDPQSSMTLIKAVDRLRRVENMAVVIIEHKIDELAGIADRIILMEEGRVVFQGCPRGLFESNSDQFVSRQRKRLPEISQLALSLRELVDIEEIPLTVEEAYQTISQSPISFQPGSPAVSQNDPPPLLEISNLNLGYPDNAFKLKDINLRVRRGEFLAIVGPNGAGKSTLAKSIIGLLGLTSGRVVIDGRDVSHLPAHERAKVVGYVFQEPEDHFVKDKVIEEVEFSRLQLAGEATHRFHATQRLLQDVGLTGYEDAFVYQLSMGQKKKLSIATMLGLDQRALILDEPTMWLDWESASHLLALLKDLNRERGLTILVITHNMRLVTEACDRAIAVRQGRIVFDGTPHDLFSDRQLVESVALIEPPVWRLSQQLRQKNGNGIRPALNIAEFIAQVRVA